MKYKVAVVDDLKMQLMILKSHLQSEGYEVTTYQDSALALKELPSQHFDLFILDIEMPEVSGMDLARALRKTPHLRDAPILFFTSSDSKETLKEAYEAGATDFLLKGQSELELKLRIKNCLNSYTLHRQTKSQSEALEIYLRILFHDLATPLSIAKNGIKLATTLTDPEKKIKRLAGAEKAVTDIQNLVSDLKLFFHQQGTSEFPEIRDVLESISFLFDERLQEKNITLKTNLNCPELQKIRIPKTFFVNQVLGNFISNSIKFSPHASEISLTIDQTEGKIRWQIIDHGPGITPETLATIKTGLSPLSSKDGSAGEKGTGSGLMIARHFLRHFNGSVDIDSSPSGTTVTVEVETC